jgi:hypothetical protein
MTLLELQKALKEGKEVTNNGGETYLKIENKYDEKEGEMYKGMEFNKKYSLEELGL